MKILILPFIFFAGIYSVNACSDELYIKLADSTHEILITGHHPNHKLDLRDSKGNDVENLDVEFNDMIIWINKDTGIIICWIEEKAKTQHFKDPPTSENKWHGKIKNWSDTNRHDALYNIVWKDKKNGIRYPYDPLIKIYPNQKDLKGPQTPPATHEIRITRDPQNGKLDLKDENGNDGSDITVDSDDEIVWINESDITVNGFEEKQDSKDHFKQKPVPDDSSSKKKWRGKVNKYRHRGHIIKYSIIWTENDVQHTYDPLIRINPNTFGN